VQNHPAVESGVNGGNGTLAWEPQPGVIAYVGYSGGAMDGAAEQALVTLADASHPLDQTQWDATNPQVVEQQNGSVDGLSIVDTTIPLGCATTPSSVGRPTGRWASIAGLPSGLPHIESADGHVLIYPLVAPLQAATAADAPQNDVLIFTDVPTARITLVGSFGTHHAAPIVEARVGGTIDWFYSSLKADVAGCWHFDITFNDQNDSVSLAFR